MSKFNKSTKNTKKLNHLNFVMRILVLFILIAGIVISCVFSSFYLKSDHKLSIEFAGGYQVGLSYRNDNPDTSTKNPSTDKLEKLLEQRVDPLGTSNINISKNSSTTPTFNVQVSNSVGITMQQFINNAQRRGYLYLVTEDGHDLLANSYTEGKDGKAGSWANREKRITTKEAFSGFSYGTNRNSHQPQLEFGVKNNDLVTEIAALLKNNQKIHLYSDIGQLLNYLRNDLKGLTILVGLIDDVAKNDDKLAQAMKPLLWSGVPGYDSIKDGTDSIYSLIKSPGSDPIKYNNLVNMLNQTKNGINTLKWKFSDLQDPNHRLSFDPNDKSNVFDPSAPFPPDQTDPGQHKSVMNAWLSSIYKIVLLPELSDFFKTNIVNNLYASYYIGDIATGVTNNQLIINDETFNQEKVRQITNLLNSGSDNNIFDVIYYANVAATFGANSLKLAIIALLTALFIIFIIMIARYRMLGLLALISIIGSLAFTLVMFTFLTNIFAPETGIALIISFSLLLEAVIGLLSRINSEYNTGKTIFNAFKTANKKTASAAFDTNIIVLVVSLAIFWFGTRAIRGFALMTVLSTFSVLLFGVVLLRLFIYFFLKYKNFENYPQWFGLLKITNKAQAEENITVFAADGSVKTSELVTQKNKKNHPWLVKIKVFNNMMVDKWNYFASAKFFKINQWNFWHKSSKWFLVGFSALFLVSGITFLAAGPNYGIGFDNYVTFEGNYSSPFSGDTQNLAEQLKQDTENVLNQNYKNQYKDIQTAFVSESLDYQATVKLIIKTYFHNNNDQAKAMFNYLNVHDQHQMQWSVANNQDISGKPLMITMVIVIAFSLVVILIYVLIRFQITFIMPLIISLLFALVAAMLIISMLQITISTITVGIMLGIVMLTLINSVIIFDNIKELKLQTGDKKNSLTKTEIISISNQGVQKSILRTVAIDSIIILASLVLMIFLGTFWAESLSMIIATIVSFIATHIIAPWLWTFFERWRVKRYRKRLAKIKKHFVGVDEYIITGIND